MTIMKRLFAFAILPVLCLGCVTGPEEVAAEKDKLAKEEIPVAQADPAESASRETSDVVPASGTDDGKGAFKKTSSGLKYRILEQGTGKRPTSKSTVVCHYRGWLDSGKEFDSSYKRGEPTEFPLNGVIAGWTEGLQLINEGGKIELDVPSRLGYGEQGMPGAIPPNARLHFEVELIKVK